MIETARERGVRIRRVVAGDDSGRNGAGIRVLWPPVVGPSVRLPFSDRSPVLRIADQEGSVLLRGNTDDRIGRVLEKSGVRLSSAVLQSARSLSEIISHEKFLARVKPAVVLWTGGNRRDPVRKSPVYLRIPGFPHVPVFRPSNDGAVTIDLKGTFLAVRCYGISRVFSWKF